MTHNYNILTILTLFALACNPAFKEGVDLRLCNSTTQSVEWAEMYIGTRQITFGILGGNGGGGKTIVDYLGAITDPVRLKLTDANQQMKEYAVNVKGVYDPHRPGKLVFEVTTNGVVVRFDPLPGDSR